MTLLIQSKLNTFQEIYDDQYIQYNM